MQSYAPTWEVTLETFAEVLRTGQWPHWAAPVKWTVWETALKTAIRQHPTQAAALLAPVLAQPEATRRLVWQFQKSTVDAIIQHLVGDDLLTRWRRKEADLQTAGRKAGVGEKKIREKLQTTRMAFVAAIARRGWAPNEIIFREIERDFFANTTSARTQPPPKAAQPSSVPTDTRHRDTLPVQSPPAALVSSPKSALDAEHSRFIGLAGLVLLHPFLALFFEDLGFTKNAEFRSETARQRAVHLLAYLAGGGPNPPEVALVLPKILVGFPPKTPLPRRIRLTAREKREAQNLLEAVLGHWTALRNTSPEALQTEFLQREGRLDLRDDGWHLTVESRPADVLLGRLPWGLSLVKLPWMTEWLHVHWV